MTRISKELCLELSEVLERDPNTKKNRERDRKAKDKNYRQKETNRYQQRKKKIQWNSVMMNLDKMTKVFCLKWPITTQFSPIMTNPGITNTFFQSRAVCINRVLINVAVLKYEPYPLSLKQGNLTKSRTIAANSNLPSISSTVYARVFRTKFGAKPKT